MRGDADHLNASIGSGLLIVSSTRKNFSASTARPHWWLIYETYTPAACADTAIELGAIAASRRRSSTVNRLKGGVPGDPANCRHGANLECGRMPANTIAGLVSRNDAPSKKVGLSAVASRSPSVGNRNNFRLHSFRSKSLKSEFSHAPTARTTNGRDCACAQIRH